MRGHEPIIAARLQGKKPPFIFINDFPCKTDWADYAEHATVSTHMDALHSLDMRFVNQINVNVAALSENRAKGLFEICKKAGASLVAASHVQMDKPPHAQTGWAEIWRSHG